MMKRPEPLGLFLRIGGVVVLSRMPEGHYEIRDTGVPVARYETLDEAAEAFEELAVSMEAQWEATNDPPY